MSEENPSTTTENPSRTRGLKPPFKKGAKPGPGRGHFADPIKAEEKQAERKIIGDVKAAAREYTEAALNTLVEVATSADAPPSARVSAADALLDRGWDKPAVNNNVNANVTLRTPQVVMLRHGNGNPLPPAAARN